MTLWGHEIACLWPFGGFVDRDGDLELSYIGYRSPNEFVFQGPKEEGYYYAIATVIGDTILWGRRP